MQLLEFEFYHCNINNNKKTVKLITLENINNCIFASF